MTNLLVVCCLGSDELHEKEAVVVQDEVADHAKEYLDVVEEVLHWKLACWVAVDELEEGQDGQLFVLEVQDLALVRGLQGDWTCLEQVHLHG